LLIVFAENKKPYLSVNILTLKDARTKQEEAKTQLANGIDPSAAKIAAKKAKQGAAANCFEVIAREWHNKHMSNKSEGHGTRTMRLLEQDVFPWLGKLPIIDIEAPDVLAALKRIEQRGAVETAHRAAQTCGQVFRHAIATGRANRNPIPDLKGALTPTKQAHHAAITDPVQIGALMLQWWADYLDSLKAGGVIVPFQMKTA